MEWLAFTPGLILCVAAFGLWAMELLDAMAGGYQAHHGSGVHHYDLISNETTTDGSA